MRVGVALGSNLGDRLENLRAARAALERIPAAQAPFLASAIYATAPVDCEEGAAEFLNAAIEFEYEGHAPALLSQLKDIEVSLGRPPRHRRNVSRAIDIDLLYAGALEIQEGNLKVPHPRMAARRFVLEPLNDIRPGLILPGQSKTITELLALLDESDKVVPLTNDWTGQ